MLFDNKSLTNIFDDFNFRNNEVAIRHKNCPIYNFFWAATCYMRDFPQGIIRPNNCIEQQTNIGVWNSRLEESSYIITRVAYGKYIINCLEEGMLSLPKGEIFNQNVEFVTRTGLYGLAKALKEAIKKYLLKFDCNDILETLEKNYIWRLEAPLTIEEALDRGRKNII